MPPTVGLFVKNDNDWVRSITANPKSTLRFKLVASDPNSQRSNKIKEVLFCKTAGYSDCKTIALSSCNANSNKTTYTCLFEEKLGDSNQTFTAYAKDNNSQSARNNNNKVIITKNGKPNVALSITNGNQFIFTNESYSIGLSSTSTDIKSARICKLPGQGLESNAVPKDCALNRHGRVNTNLTAATCSVSNGRIQSCNWNRTAPANKDAYYYVSVG